MKRVSFLIAPDLLERLRVLKARTGVTESEQIREGIRMWLESREWPARPTPRGPMREE
jgi:predicted DNA-binding protein